MNAFLDSTVQDLRYTVRALLRAPMFASAAILTLALGIGMTTSIFSVVDLILFRGLPYLHEDRLVSVGITGLSHIDEHEVMLGRAYVDIKDLELPFEAITSWSGASDCDINDRSPVRIRCAKVESTFLSTLGVRPAIGRNFTVEEDQPNAPGVALLSHGLWRSRFGGDLNIVNQRFLLDGRSTRIVGVLPADFELPTLAKWDVLIPQALNEFVQRTANPGRVLWTFARLKPGATAEQARLAVETTYSNVLKTMAPPEFELGIRVRSLRDRQVLDARLASWVLFASVVAVLLIACANAANLMIARSVSRKREHAVRVALGASRGRLIRQAMTYSLFLGLGGGGLGCVFAFGLLRLFGSIAPEGIIRLQQASIDMRVLLFTFAASVFSTLLFGLAPILTNRNVEPVIGPRTAGEKRPRTRYALIAGQIAISLILLTGAVLFLRTLWNLQNVPLGVGTEQTYAARIVLGSRYAGMESIVAFWDALEERLQKMPGSFQFSVSDSVPPGAPARSRPYFIVQAEGHPRAAENTGGVVAWRFVSPHYFSTLRIPIVKGRNFQEQDRSPGQNSIILSEELAHRLYGSENPLQKRIRFDASEPPTQSTIWYAVIGVAGEVRNKPLADRNDPEYYLVRKHSAEAYLGGGSGWAQTGVILIRSAMPSVTVSESLRAEVAALDPTLPVNFEALSDRAERLASRPRFNALLFTLFAGVALLLAAIGLYGVVSFNVAQRTQEIGVRIALGATPGAIVRFVMSSLTYWTLAGFGVGLAGSLLLERTIHALLFQIAENDVWSLSVAVVVLISVSLLAMIVPSLRATRVSPLQALRHE